jgi:hypothetical protein
MVLASALVPIAVAGPEEGEESSEGEILRPIQVRLI